MNKKNNMISAINWFCYGLILFCAASFTTDKSIAQGTAQVLISGFSPVLESPLLSDLERNYQLGNYTTQFIYISPNRQPRSFQFQLTLEHEGETLIDMTSEPIIFEPGIHTYRTFDDEPQIQFPLSYGEWLSRLSPDIENTGILSEGNYVLRIEALPSDPDALIPSIPGVAVFNVQYADPPLLLTPFEEAEITSQLPIFSWTPVTGLPFGSSIEYELFIVEVYPGQAPYQALESNIELVREVLIDQTSFVYSYNELPLEPGKLYAWQVIARDANRILPILDSGETEFRTFRIQSEGLGSLLTTWSYPINSPFIKYDFEDTFDIEESGTELYIDDRLPIEIMGVGTSANFDQLLIDVETQRIIDGSITIEDPLAFEVTINPLNDTFTDYQPVVSGSELTLSDGLLLELGANVQIDAQGLQPQGTHRALISYSGYGKEEWTATYSEDFVVDLTPFNILSGRVDFAANGVAKGYADVTGFHINNQSDPVIAQLPDRLLLPDPSMGYISLKRNGAALVDLEEDNNQFAITSRPNTNLELVLTGLQGEYNIQAPRFRTSFENIKIDAATGVLLQGSIQATLDDTTNSYVLDHSGIPLAATSVSINKDATTTELTIHGVPTLFGRPIQNSEHTSVTISSDRIARGIFALSASGAYVLAAQAESGVRISIETLDGFYRG